MPSTSYGAGEERPPGIAPASPETDRPDQQDVSSTEDVDIGWWEKALSDAERAEKPWRARGRDIVQIYRGDIPITRPRGGKYSSTSSYATKQDTASAFNILYANTEVMLPAAYSKPPDPVVKSRFIKKTADPIQPPPPPPMMMPPPGMGPPGLPPGGPPPPGAGPPGAPGMPLGPSASPGAMMGGPPAPPTLPPGGPPPPMPPSPGMDAPPPGVGGPPTPPSPGGPLQGGPPGLGPSLPAPTPMGLPEQNDIETAAAVMEKALEIVVSDEASHEAVKSAVRDMLLPGRGVCRVRWKPVIKQIPVDDPVPEGST